jgi:signal transduction histidine kinase/CheY-like chemotaxis protein
MIRSISGSGVAGIISSLRPVFFVFFACLVVTYSGSALAQQKTAADVAESARLLLNKELYDTAITLATQAISSATETHDTAARIKAMRIYAKALSKTGQKKEAIKLFYAALRLCSAPRFEKEMALIYGELGYTGFLEGETGDSKAFFNREIEILSRIQGRDSVGNQLINLAVMHMRLREFDSAAIALARVKDILTRYNDSSIRGYYYFNVGSRFTYVDQPDSARYYYLLAYDIWKALGNESQLFRVTFNLGFYYFQKKDYQKAIYYYQQSVGAARKFAAKREVAHVYGTMAESYAELNDFKNAYKYIYHYATLSDSLNKEDISEYSIRLDKQFQTEKNRELIQAQDLELKTTRLHVQEQRNTILVIIIVFVLLLFIMYALFVYYNFRNNVRKKVEEAKGRFFANVAHEIRTPLSMIRGPLEVMSAKTDDPSMLAQLDLAARNTQRLNDLINQMLDISKFDSANYKLHESMGDLEAFADQLFYLYYRQAAEKNITLHCEADAHVGNLLFDKDALEKICNNLVGNAIKYTPAGGNAGISLQAEKHAEQVQLIINVWDSGPGIPAGEEDKIFDRFYRAEQYRKEGIKGIGIGLALVRELVTLMNGTVVVNSDPGKGAVFTVRCTLSQLASQQQPAIPAASDLGSVLIVEDDKDILDFNAALLQDEGYSVLLATNGADAFKLLQETLPDIVITDLMMPGMDGMELLRNIRSNPLTAHIPVIILSAKGSAGEKERGIAAGAQSYLSKPFSPAELKGLVRNQLQLISVQKARYQAQTAEAGKSVEERFTGEDPFTQRCFELIHQHLDDPALSVEKLAELMNINRSHFQRKIKALTGFSPSELIRTIRLGKARELLLARKGNITETAYATGFTSQSYFTKCFSEHFGYPPSQVS